LVEKSPNLGTFTLHRVLAQQSLHLSTFTLHRVDLIVLDWNEHVEQRSLHDTSRELTTEPESSTPWKKKKKGYVAKAYYFIGNLWQTIVYVTNTHDIPVEPDNCEPLELEDETIDSDLTLL